MRGAISSVFYTSVPKRIQLKHFRGCCPNYLWHRGESSLLAYSECCFFFLRWSFFWEGKAPKVILWLEEKNAENGFDHQLKIETPFQDVHPIFILHVGDELFGEAEMCVWAFLEENAPNPQKSCNGRKQSKYHISAKTHIGSFLA